MTSSGISNAASPAPTTAMTAAATTTATTWGIDKSLLRGLDPVMTYDEQVQLTALLVSGDTDCLVQACRIFHELEELLKIGIAHPNQRSDEQHMTISNSFQPTTTKYHNHRSHQHHQHHPGYNNYEVRVLEAKKQIDLERKQLQHTLPLPVRMPRLVVLEAFDPDPFHPVPVDPGTAASTGMEETANNITHEGNQKTNRKKLLGLIPRRNPNQRTNHRPPTLTFVDYEWDGTIGLAFTKLTVKKSNNNGPVNAATRRMVRPSTTNIERISKKDSCGRSVHVESEPVYPTSGYDAIVDRVGGYDAQIIQTSDESTAEQPQEKQRQQQQQQVQRPMVLIASTHNDASKLAIARGDVVTHVNGQEFVGTAEDLKMLIRLHYQDVVMEGTVGGNNNSSNKNKLEIVVNGESCVAKALQLRSLVQ